MATMANTIKLVTKNLPTLPLIYDFAEVFSSANVFIVRNPFFRFIDGRQITSKTMIAYQQNNRQHKSSSLAELTIFRFSECKTKTI